MVVRWGSACIALIVAACLGCARLAPGPVLPGVLKQIVLDSGTYVAGLAIGPRGELWLATLNYGNGPSGIIEIDPNGQAHRYTRPESFNRVAVDAHDVAWFTVGAGASGQQPKLVRVGPRGAMRDYPLPVEGNFQGITIGPDGVPWFVDAAAGSIGRIHSGDITYYGPASGDPTEITAARDGKLWFTEPSSNKVGNVSPDGSLNEIRVPTPSSQPEGIGAGADGSIWFCESKANNVARVLPSGRIVEFRLPTPDAWPVGIVVSKSGQVWFTELVAGKVGRLDATTGKFAEFDVPGGGYPGPIARAGDGTLWVAVNAKRDAALGLVTSRSKLMRFSP